MNEQIIKGKWKEIKGDIQTSWGRLTDDEIEKAKGSLHSLSGIIQQKYGIALEAASQKLNSLVEKYNEKTDKTATDAKVEDRKIN